MACHSGAAVLPADAVGGKLVVPPAADFVGVRAGQHLDDVVQADAEAASLADAIDAGEEFLRGQRAVEGGARREAIVAAAAVVRRERLAEIAQQFGPAAAGGFGVMDDLPQLLAGDLAVPSGGFLLDEPLSA